MVDEDIISNSLFKFCLALSKQSMVVEVSLVFHGPRFRLAFSSPILYFLACKFITSVLHSEMVVHNVLLYNIVIYCIYCGLKLCNIVMILVLLWVYGIGVHDPI